MAFNLLGLLSTQQCVLGFLHVACSYSSFILPAVYLIRHWRGVINSSGVRIAHSLFLFYFLLFWSCYQRATRNIVTVEMCYYSTCIRISLSVFQTGVIVVSHEFILIEPVLFCHMFSVCMGLFLSILFFFFWSVCQSCVISML